MAFNRKAKLRDNIETIRTVFELDKAKRQATPEEKAILVRYCGFGGLKCILNPANDLLDTVRWAKSDLELFPMMAGLHQMLRSNTSGEAEYKRYTDSLKNSVLTAFYTPAEIVSAIADTLHENGITPQRFLDPSAGQGVFIDAFERHAPGAEVMAYEKDLLTGELLSHLYPDHKIRVEGFEKIEHSFNGYFDVVSSNIPFGDIAVFDPLFSGSRDNARRQSAKAIRNYFFVKGLDVVREGGIVAFITSQGVMNAPIYESQRRLLMENANLVSAIRLPNNLFTENANTEVGSDLIVLQKNPGKKQISEAEQAFFKTYITPSGTTANQYFRDGHHIIYTRRFLDTDPYGKPAIIYLHEGGVPGMASDLKRMLAEDFVERLDKTLYQRFSRQSSVTGKSDTLNNKRTKNLSFATVENKTAGTLQASTSAKKPEFDNKLGIENPVITLYDLFGFSEQERRQEQTGSGKRNSVRKKKQVPPE